METDIRSKLNDYYKRMKIYPDNFQCQHLSFCKKFANQEMTEAKMSMVGSQYGLQYPRITVVSLDPPKGGFGEFKSSAERTIEYISRFHESENFLFSRPNVHWAMTQIIVKDLLVFWRYPAQPDSAVVAESYSGRVIENVSAYFAHVNVAKCSMNNEENGQADFQVHQKCGYSYLLKELEILMPEILVSQGKRANTIMSHLLRMPGVEDALPAAKTVRIGSSQVMWLPMDHPARHIAEIRRGWPFYVNAVKEWHSIKSPDPIHTRADGFPPSEQPESDPQPSSPGVSTEPILGESGFTDFGLYKCLVCGRMVMGYEKESHEREKHAGKSVEWKKVR